MDMEVFQAQQDNQAQDIQWQKKQAQPTWAAFGFCV
jgi:hypothetical protein